MLAPWLLMAAISPAICADLVKDEALRTELMQAAFPGAKISRSHSALVDWGMRSFARP